MAMLKRFIRLFLFLPVIILLIPNLTKADEEAVTNDPSSQITFKRSFGGDNAELGSSVQQTSDGGYILLGSTKSFGKGEFDFYLIKTNEYGEKLWSKTFGGGLDDFGESVRQTLDGGYILLGTTYSFAEGKIDMYLIKTDEKGNEMWSKAYGGPGRQRGYCVQRASDGGYILLGDTSKPFGEGGCDMFLVKTDSSGVEQWNNSFDGNVYDYGYSVQEAFDDGYMLLGYSEKLNRVGSNLFLIKANERGRKKWNMSLKGTSSYYGYSIDKTNDNGYILIGSTYLENIEQVYLLKIDKNGKKLWSKMFVRNGRELGRSVQQTADGGYILLANTYSSGYSSASNSFDIYLIKTDDNGKKIWSKVFWESGDDEGYSVQQTSDGGYILVGYTKSFGDSNGDIYLIKTDAKGETALQIE
jgi:hypothetical protein